MGALVGKFLNRLSDKRILILGLDAAGKTTVLYRLRIGEVVTTLPTIGFNIEALEYKNKLRFTMWDVGGQDKLRPLWAHYYRNSDALIFVVDSSDSERVEEAADELRKAAADPLLSGIPVLVLCNKSDMASAIPVPKLCELMGLDKLGFLTPPEKIPAAAKSSHKSAKGKKAPRQHNWYAQSCSAVNGVGLYEGLDWLASQLS
ncbi:ADP-ribosylation factor 4 [Pelomyxa schiedti]|nr:ADP-ribosylation factor 4 [Pelomyxa schiedti]